MTRVVTLKKRKEIGHKLRTPVDKAVSHRGRSFHTLYIDSEMDGRQ